MGTRRRPLVSVAAFAVAAALLSACGGDREPAAGTSDRPLVADLTTESSERTPGSKSGEPGYEQLVAGQKAKPRSRFSPCNLVTKAQARAIVGEPLAEPVEGAQGPTCIYSAEEGDAFVTIAIQALDFGTIKPHLRGIEAIEAAGRTGYCGRYGQDMLYLPLARMRMLVVSGPCRVARQFAEHALREL